MNKKLLDCITDYDINRFKVISKDLSLSATNRFLCHLVKGNHYPFVEELCKSGYDFNFLNGRCLLLAIRNGYHEMFDILIRYGNCDVNMRYGLPLYEAVNVLSLDLVKSLCKYNVNLKLDNGRAFLRACILNSLNIVEFLLIKNPSYSRVKDSSGAHYAILNNNEAMLLLFIRYGSILSDRHLKAAYHIGNDRLVEIVKANKV